MKKPRTINFEGQNIYKALQPEIQTLLDAAKRQGIPFEQVAIALSSYLLVALCMTEGGNFVGQTVCAHPGNPGELYVVELGVVKVKQGGKPHAN